MRYVIGADEVGRGCVAGDVLVCAVMVPEDKPTVEGVRDSKKLSATRREAVNQRLFADPAVISRVATRPATLIDSKGISLALRECFTEAIQGLLDMLVEGDEVSVRVDGNPFPLDVTAPVTFIVRGDDSEWVIGAASIIAKVTRDRYMGDMGDVHPGYGFEKHAGYGTPEHIEAIKKLGLSPIHRASFCKAWTPTKVFEDASILDLFGG